jgi:hypothetical protein
VLSFPAARKPPLPKLQTWNADLSIRQYSQLLPNFRFRFRLCASSCRGSVFRDPPCTRTGTSRNHFASRCDIFDGSRIFNGGTEVDSGPDGNRTIAGPLGAKHAPVARHCHDIVTLDESWIYLFNEHDLMWTALGEIVIDRERHTVQSPKFMLTVVCNPIGFHVLKALPEGCKFNA